jgi:hypothetical protein
MLRKSRRGALSFFAPIAIAASLLLAPGVASAADSTLGQDEVTLKNGGSIRGTVVAAEPGVDVKIIELGATAVRTLPWSEVADVQRGKYTATTSTTAPSPPPPPPPPTYAPGPTYAQGPSFPGAVQMPVRLHVSSPEPATVVAREEYARIGWTSIGVEQDVCASPCGSVFNASSGLTYRIKGDFPTSPSFSLIGRTGDVEVAVTPGSRGLRAGGIVLIALGGAAVLVGGAVAAAGAIQSSTTTYNDDGTTSQGDGSGTETTGFVVMGGGVAAIIGGVIALVSSKTSIDVHSMESSGQPASFAPRYWAGEF